MALVVKDRVRVTSATTGTGTFTLGSAVNSFQDFSVIGDGNTTYYAIVDSASGDWEVGLGTYTASGTTLSRDTILESSNSGSAVNFTSGTKDVFVTYPAEKAVYFDASDAVNIDNIKLDGSTISTIDSGTLQVTPDSSFNSTGQIKLPAGSTAQRSGSPATGMIRYNTSLNQFEGYNGSIWGGIGGAQAGGAIVTNQDEATVSYTIAAGENGFSVGPVTVASGVTITVSAGQRWLVL